MPKAQTYPKANRENGHQLGCFCHDCYVKVKEIEAREKKQKEAKP